MRVTSKVDYAVRACLELAARYDSLPDRGGQWVKADDVAAAQSISLSNVLSILSELKRAELVKSRRGADGGYRLAYRPADIVIADIVRAIDGPLANIAGRHVEDASYEGAAAPLRDVWVALRAAMRTVLDEVTLADLASNHLPARVRELVADDEAWTTRPHGRNTRVSGVRSQVPGSPN